MTPVGNPETERFTLPLNWYSGKIDSVEVLVAGWPTLMVPGPEMMERWRMNVRLSVVVTVRLPDVPVMVRLLVPSTAVLPALIVSVLVPL